MDDNFTLLWIGKRHQAPAVSSALSAQGYHLLTATEASTALEILRRQEVHLVVLENDVSCIQGELSAVRLKSAGPRVPILLLCSPPETGAQIFFVNLILDLESPAELLLQAIANLMPRPENRRTA